ncbi:hypothetical protein Tco_0715520 [Tanacetum coccineum]
MSNTVQPELTVNEYLTRVRDNSGPGVFRPLFEENIKFEFWGQCIDELKDNVFLGNNDENPLEHILNITSIVNILQSLGVSRDQDPPSPDYVPGPEEPEQAPPSPIYVPFVPDLFYQSLTKDDDPEEDDEEDPEEDPADYPADRGDDRDDEEPSDNDDDDDDE